MKVFMLILEIIWAVIKAIVIFAWAIIVAIFQSVFGFIEETGRDGRAESQSSDTNKLP